MAFTDRYIKVPIKVFDRKLQEMTGQSEDEDSYMMINPFDIVSYRPSFDKDDEDRNELTDIVDKTGDRTLVYLSVEQFESLLNKSQK